MQKVSDIKINIPKHPYIILNTLHDAGYEAYIVGGCVRDSILGKVPSDFDITTNAKPEAVKRLFRKTIDTGIKHGTVSVLFYDNDTPVTYEVTTYRVDGVYEDGRHPKDVKFVSDLKEDLLRRDFTINAMAYNNESGLVDEFGGLLDLDKEKIVAVGNPIERFTEDALRLLRAIRFAAKLGFTIDDDTKNAIPKLAKNLSLVSKERVQVELTKTITSDNPSYCKLIFDLGLAPYICKDFDKLKVGKFEKKLSTPLAYACLLYNVEPKTAYDMLRELKLDNNTINKVTYMLSAKQHYDVIVDFYKKKKYADYKIAIKELINGIGYDLTYDFLRLISINEGVSSCLKKTEDFVKECFDEKTPITIGDLDINGHDLMELGFKGEEIGVSLASLLKLVHKQKELNKKKILQEVASRAYNIYKEGSYGLH